MVAVDSGSVEPCFYQYLLLIGVLPPEVGILIVLGSWSDSVTFSLLLFCFFFYHYLQKMVSHVSQPHVQEKIC